MGWGGGGGQGFGQWGVNDSNSQKVMEGFGRFLKVLGGS